jgi:hypothetical protein
MSDKPNTLSVLNLLLDLKDSTDLKTVQNYHDRLSMVVDFAGFSEDQRKALKQVFDTSGRWVRNSGGTAAMVRGAVERAIPLFK